MTIRGIIHKKTCTRFDETNWYQKLFLFYKLFAIVAIYIAIVYPEVAIVIAEHRNFIIPKVFIFINAIIFIQEIIWFFLRIKIVTEKNVKRIAKLTKSKWQKTDSIEKLEWIPIDDILYLLFKYQWRSNQWFLKEIGKNNKLYKKLGDILEKRNIIVRGEKNARVINKELSETEIYSKLQLSPIDKISENKYSYNTV